MIVHYYIQSTPVQQVQVIPCCSSMLDHWKSAAVTVLNTKLQLSAGLTHSDYTLLYCPWCGAKAEVTNDLS